MNLPVAPSQLRSRRWGASRSAGWGAPTTRAQTGTGVAAPTRLTAATLFPGAIVLAAGVLPPSSATAQPGPLEGFEAYVAEAVEAWGVPGLAIAVVKDGAVVYTGAFGVRSLDAPEPVTPRTLFAIGSTTKAMTAAAIGMLVDDGALRWDDRVTEHLPSFELHDPYVTRELRVRDLLTHNAGLGNADFLWYGQEVEPGEVLRRIRYAEPAYSLRSSFVYQNIMYAAAGALVEAVSGVPWARFIQTRVFDPLGMAGTVPTLGALERRADVARPHDSVDGQLQEIENASVDAIPAAGSVWSSVEDMSLWTRFLLSGGVTESGDRLLAEETVETLFRPHVIVPAAQFYPTARLTRPRWTTYALGWFQHDYQGRAVDFHTGSIDGMVAIHGLIRSEGIGVFVVANRDHAELRHALMYRVFDLFGEVLERDWNADLLELYAGLEAEADSAWDEVVAQRVTGTRPSLPLAEYTGVYSDPLYGTAHIRAGESDALRVSHGGGLQGTAEHWHHDTFLVEWDARWRGRTLMTFTLGTAGRPRSVEFGGRTLTRMHEEP